MATDKEFLAPAVSPEAFHAADLQPNPLHDVAIGANMASGCCMEIDEVADIHDSPPAADADRAEQTNDQDAAQPPQDAEHSDGCTSKLLARDVVLSRSIWQWSPGPVVDVILAGGCLAFFQFAVPVWCIAWCLLVPWPVAFKPASFAYPAAVIGTFLATTGMKACFQRNRPNAAEELGKRWFYLTFETVNMHHSFPSGDASQGGCFGYAAWWQFVVKSNNGSTEAILLTCGLFLLLNLVLPMWVAMGRIYFGRHHVLDTVAGAGVGIGVSAIIMLVFEYIYW